ncbi:MAG: cobalamin-binding protein [Nitrospiraceae bacterium]|nr:MAG: cobalamin-binding protein [Nitrospiraceae bacterium]
MKAGVFILDFYGKKEQDSKGAGYINSMHGGRYPMKRSIIQVLVCFIFILLIADTASAKSPERIISLAPSITEILFAAGLGDKIVGVTTFCDHPEEAKQKPKIGGMSNPSLEEVVLLKPDIVIMTTDGNPKEFEQKLHSLGIRTYVFESLTIPELPQGLKKMGEALEEDERFNSLATKIDETLNAVRSQGSASGKKILFIVWPEPLIVAGRQTAVDDAIGLLGGINIGAIGQGRYPKYSIEEIFHRSPDIIFIGKGMVEEGDKNMRELSKGLLERIAHVSAVKKGKVFFVGDGLYRLGPRVVDGIQELAGYLK